MSSSIIDEEAHFAESNAEQSWVAQSELRTRENHKSLWVQKNIGTNW